MAPAALLIGRIDHARKEWESLGSKLKLIEFNKGNREEFINKCSSEFSDVVAIYRSNASNSLSGSFNKELVDQLPKSLKYICHNGAGYDNIDVEACTAKGIQVSATPVAVNNATADIAILLVISVLRQITIPFMALRESKWRGKAGLGHDPQGKVLGILGMGGIGKEVANRARAFGMKIQYHNRSRLPLKEEGSAHYVSFEELLSTSDVISLNLALNKSTTHIIGAPEFKKMKDGVFIVNTARGALIDEKALVEALDSGKVASVGLDVFEKEPEIEPELVKNEKVVLLPHIGTMTIETQKEMELLVLENLKMAVESGTLVTQVAEQRPSKL